MDTQVCVEQRCREHWDLGYVDIEECDGLLNEFLYNEVRV